MGSQWLVIIILLVISSSGWADPGLINVKSRFIVPHTADRFIGLIQNKGMQLIAHIKHSDSAQKAGISLKPTELLIFGSAKIGAPLMVCQRSIGIDLPQKLLVWEDNDGQVWMTYNDPSYLQARHEISEECSAGLTKFGTAMKELTTVAGDSVAQ